MRWALVLLSLMVPGVGWAAGVPLPAGVLAGTVYGATRAGSAGSTIPFCVLNPGASSVQNGVVPSAGPAASMFRQGSVSTSIAVPGLEAGVIQSGNNQVTPQFYASGSASLSFTDAADGVLVFAPNGVTLGAHMVPGFSGYTTSVDSTTGIVSVYFVITVNGCSLPFQASYLS